MYVHSTYSSVLSIVKSIEFLLISTLGDLITGLLDIFTNIYTTSLYIHIVHLHKSKTKMQLRYIICITDNGNEQRSSSDTHQYKNVVNGRDCSILTVQFIIPFHFISSIVKVIFAFCDRYISDQK